MKLAFVIQRYGTEIQGGAELHCRWIAEHVAAYVTSLKPGDILFLVGAAFSLAASAFFPPLVLGVFWKRANKWGAIIGMLAGLGVSVAPDHTLQPLLTLSVSRVAPVLPYLLMVLLLIFRPKGLLGTRED